MLPFKKPHPFIFNYKSVVIPGLIAFLLISLFAPFGFQGLDIGNRLLFGLIMGLLSSLSIVLVVFGVRKLLPNWMMEDNWTLGKEIVLFVLVVATICLLIFFSFVLFDLSSSAPMVVFKRVVLYTTVISIFPITILVLFEQYSFQKQCAKKAVELNESLSVESRSTLAHRYSTGNLLFEAENGKVELQLDPDKLLYLKADGNYVEVFYLDQHNQVRKKLIRNRLKGLLEVLPSRQFFHAHKSYIVNGNQIERVEGNARNFELAIYGTDVLVPVSRSNSKVLSTFLKSLH